jgi:acrylyl-CoA reductase (NADPH)
MADSFRAFTATQDGDAVNRAIGEMSVDDLPTDGLLVAVERSSVNYKDGLATIPKGRVARISPLIPGIDLSGTVTGDGTAAFPTGTKVLAHGYDLGVSRHGGFAELARVPEEWLVKLPDGLDAREAMGIGTAGFTAALSILELQDRGLTPDGGPVLVTGATGGVGSIAVSILSSLGFEVTASSGKAEAEPYLRSLGATNIIPREELAGEGKALDSATYAGAVDCVGGTTLANVLSKLKYGASVAASGNTGGMAVPTTVMPFILRGVSLIGIDSVAAPIDRRRKVWELLATSMRPAGLADVIKDIPLGGLEAALDTILAGGVTGRTVVEVTR